MKDKAITPTRNERVMREDDFIVSKTDLKGRITYGNEIFIEFSGYTEQELLGSQHNIIRHPDMPRAAFKLAWDTIQAGREFFAYVKNMSKDGGFYSVSPTSRQTSARRARSSATTRCGAARDATRLPRSSRCIARCSKRSAQPAHGMRSARVPRSWWICSNNRG